MIQYSIGELIDRLTITNLKIWHTEEEIEKLRLANEDPKEIVNLCDRVISFNTLRNELVESINEFFAEKEKKKPLPNFAKLGKDTEIFPETILIQPETMYIHDRVMISEYAWLMGGKHLHIGNFVHVAAGVTISGGGETYIGDFAVLCAGSKLISGTDSTAGDALIGPMVSPETRNVDRSQITISKYAFIGTNAIIFPGVTVGVGAVIAAGSIVTKDCEPWTVYKGCPAKPFKERPSKEILTMAEQEYKKYNIVESLFKQGD